MVRIARVVVPGYPHHVTQRGCRRQQTFFTSRDYRHYLELLQNRALDAGILGHGMHTSKTWIPAKRTLWRDISEWQ